MKVVVLGLSLSSSWGNGHATTFRALLRAFAARGHDILFLERDVPWYRKNRDIADPAYCRLEYYGSVEELKAWRAPIEQADAVIVGSYVPDGAEVGRYVQRTARGITAFYDIDTPVTLAKLERGDTEYLSPDLIPDYDVYLSFTGGPILERIEREYGSPAARALYCSVDSEAYPALKLPKRWDLTYLGTYSEDRQPTLERLLIEPARRLPHLRFAVAGPQYPEGIDWPDNVERIDHLPPAEHPSFYAASRYTLNVTRADMIAAGWSPSVRLFEAAACGTPVISDVWDGIGALFEPDREILLAQSTAEVIERLSESSARSAEKIGSAARARILAAHSAVHRARELETYLVDATAARRKPIAFTPKEQPVMQKDQKIALVTGGSGFIGSHICEALLAEGARVLCLDNFLTGRRENIRHLERDDRFELLDCDVIDRLPFRIRGGRTRFTHIYHLACAASPPHYQADPEHTMLTNVVGTRNMLHLAEQNGARLLLTSTSEVYGDPEVHPQSEDYRGWVSCTGPRACYDEGKRAAETLAFDYLRNARAEVRVARIFNTYGPRMRPDDGRVVSNVICQALAGEDITIYGDGAQTRSFCYVSDLVDGLIRLMDSDKAVGFPVNLGNPNELTVSDLVDRVLAMTNSRSRVIHTELPEDDPRRRKPDIGRARELLDWEPKVSLQQGLEATIAWFRQEGDIVEPWRGVAGAEGSGAERRLIQAAE
ncbi:bifunctional glycosyltransferase/UDP-glucuronate decarboxylase [Sphingosinicella rhizophila]|uniref:UDP-glucuronate decarboxylase n=1 Tax=Sphingosinicella rhizophila TaxID=3050082 RepID=A0ABU3QAF0_9SPHN|nr:GDP-mannose 4,6-dehydratase [Sphingosinicella sp. GR2756]MDT9600386.1 GDP-mannose 4,6-dehydratase [Sphingosinicella sp. GR2756]